MLLEKLKNFMVSETPILETNRLKLVPLGLKHLSVSYVNWLNDSEVNKYLESGGDYSIEKLSEFLQQVENSNILFWAIHIKKCNKHIGNIKINPINAKHKFAEYGIMMGDKLEWSKGYAKEATSLVLSYCFSDVMDLRKINLGVYSENTGAVELYKKLGFIEEGRYKKHVITQAGYDDVLRMAIFKPNHE